MSYRQLTEAQRLKIWSMKRSGSKQSEIARELNVHRSTVSRELNRNSGLYGYDPHIANQLAAKRKHSHGDAMSKDIYELVQMLSKMGWDRQQLDEFLIRHHPELNPKTADDLVGMVLKHNAESLE